MENTARVILQTDRLLLRELTQEDAGEFFRLNSDPDVMRYTGDDPLSTREEAEKMLRNYDHYRRYGIGRWAVIKKSDNRFIGYCGFKYSADVDEYDIGFRLFKNEWNKGYATEAAKACIEYAFENFSLNMIVGRAMKVNEASIKVLSKIGLSYWKDDACGMADGVIYKIERIPGPPSGMSC